MISREKLLKSPEYWFEHVQNDLYGQVIAYMKAEGINQNQLARRLGVSKGYISQILNGRFNYTLKKLIELSLAIGKVPAITYKSFSAILRNERHDRPPQQKSRNGRATSKRKSTRGPASQ